MADRLTTFDKSVVLGRDVISHDPPISTNDAFELQPLPQNLSEEVAAEPRSRLRLFAVLLGLNARYDLLHFYVNNGPDGRELRTSSPIANSGSQLSIFIAALDQTIIGTAIPTIASELQSSSGYVWIGGAYLLANAAAGPIWTKLSDIWGRKPILLSAVALFFCSSVICAKATSMTMLIAGRALQGTAAGGIVQMVYISLSDLFSMRTRSIHMGVTSFMWAIAGGVGPIVGGALTEKVSWRWCWWINLPVTGMTFILLLLFLDVHNPKTPIAIGIKAVDWAGSLSIIGVTLMLLLGLQFGGTVFAWNSSTVVCLIIFGVLMVGVFVWSEKKLAKYPLMPVDLFKHTSNVACMSLCFFHGMVYIGLEYYLPLYFQSVLEASPLRSGILIIPTAVTEGIMGAIVGILIHRTGRYLELLYTGVVLMMIGNGLYCTFGAQPAIGQIIGLQIVAGLGIGFLFEAPLIALQALVPQDNVATATATFSFVRNVATSLSVVIAGVIFQNSMDSSVKSLSSPPISLPSNITEDLSGGGAAAHVTIISTIQDPGQKMAVKVAFATSIRNIWIFYTCVAALAGVSTAFIKRNHLSREHVETRTGIKTGNVRPGGTP